MFSSQTLSHRVAGQELRKLAESRELVGKGQPAETWAHKGTSGAGQRWNLDALQCFASQMKLQEV